jgi:hypothetical protein
MHHFTVYQRLLVLLKFSFIAFIKLYKSPLEAFIFLAPIIQDECIG